MQTDSIGADKKYGEAQVDFAPLRVSGWLRLRRLLPHPQLVLSYALRAALMWVFVRVGLAMVKVLEVQAEQGPLLALLAATLSWFDHHRSGENFFHSSMGARLILPLSAAFLFPLLLELVVP